MNQIEHGKNNNDKCVPSLSIQSISAKSSALKYDGGRGLELIVQKAVCQCIDAVMEKAGQFT